MGSLCVWPGPTHHHPRHFGTPSLYASQPHPYIPSSSHTSPLAPPAPPTYSSSTMVCMALPASRQSLLYTLYDLAYSSLSSYSAPPSLLTRSHSPAYSNAASQLPEVVGWRVVHPFSSRANSPKLSRRVR